MEAISAIKSRPWTLTSFCDLTSIQRRRRRQRSLSVADSCISSEVQKVAYLNQSCQI